MEDGGILMVDVSNKVAEGMRMERSTSSIKTSSLHIMHYIIHRNSSIKHQNFFTVQSALHHPS